MGLLLANLELFGNVENAGKDMENKKKIIESEVEVLCQRGCKISNYKFSEIITTMYGDRKSIKFVYVCTICGKKH